MARLAPNVLGWSMGPCCQNHTSRRCCSGAEGGSGRRDFRVKARAAGWCGWGPAKFSLSFPISASDQDSMEDFTRGRGPGETEAAPKNRAGRGHQPTPPSRCFFLTGSWSGQMPTGQLLTGRQMAVRWDWAGVAGKTDRFSAAGPLDQRRCGPLIGSRQTARPHGDGALRHFRKRGRLRPGRTRVVRLDDGLSQPGPQIATGGFRQTIAHDGRPRGSHGGRPPARSSTGLLPARSFQRYGHRQLAITAGSKWGGLRRSQRAGRGGDAVGQRHHDSTKWTNPPCRGEGGERRAPPGKLVA